jgi:hypothetical protein
MKLDPAVVVEVGQLEAPVIRGGFLGPMPVVNDREESLWLFLNTSDREDLRALLVLGAAHGESDGFKPFENAIAVEVKDDGVVGRVVSGKKRFDHFSGIVEDHEGTIYAGLEGRREGRGEAGAGGGVGNRGIAAGQGKQSLVVVARVIAFQFTDTGGAGGLVVGSIGDKVEIGGVILPLGTHGDVQFLAELGKDAAIPHGKFIDEAFVNEGRLEEGVHAGCGVKESWDDRVGCG